MARFSARLARNEQESGLVDCTGWTGSGPRQLVAALPLQAIKDLSGSFRFFNSRRKYAGSWINRDRYYNKIRQGQLAWMWLCDEQNEAGGISMAECCALFDIEYPEAVHKIWRTTTRKYGGTALSEVCGTKNFPGNLSAAYFASKRVVSLKVTTLVA